MGLRELLQKRAEKKITSQVEKDLGNKSLAYISRFIRGTIPTAGKDAVRKRVITGIEGDLKRVIKKNPSATVEELIHDAVTTPDYMVLLKELDMDRSHLEVLAQEALREAKR